MANTKSSNSRSNLRYPPQAPIHALIDTEFVTTEFIPTISALIFDESFHGCGLIVLDTPRLQVGDRIRIQVGKLPIFKAEVRWRREIAEDVIKLGVHFTD